MLRNLVRCALMAATCGMITLAVAHAQSMPPLDIHREAVDAAQYPWSAIGKLYNETGGACTAVIIARDKVLTAAHCIYNERTQRFIPAAALHFLVGYTAGRYSVHARVASYVTGTGFDRLRYDATSNADWAVLSLDEPLPAEIEPLKLSAGASPSGTKAVIAGYPQDRAFAMTADADCELREPIDDGKLVTHTCRGIAGYSGAPILIGTGDKVEIAGIQIATVKGDGWQKMLAVPAQTVQQALLDDAPRPSTLFAVNNMAGSLTAPTPLTDGVVLLSTLAFLRPSHVA
jgi:protease YdgD